MPGLWVLSSPRFCLLGDMGEGPQGHCVLWLGCGCPWAVASPLTLSLLSPQPTAALASVSTVATACLAQPSYATVPEPSRAPAASTVSGRLVILPSTALLLRLV